jgi:hypothetical protein
MSTTIYIRRQLLLGSSNQGQWDEQGKQHAWENMNEYRVDLLVENLKVKPLGSRRSRWDDIKMGLRHMIGGIGLHSAFM